MRTIELFKTRTANRLPRSCSSRSHPPAHSPNRPTGTVSLHAKTIPMAGSHCYLLHKENLCAHPDQLQRARRGRIVIVVSNHSQKSNQNALDDSRMEGAKNGCFASSYFACTPKQRPRSRSLIYSDLVTYRPYPTPPQIQMTP